MVKEFLNKDYWAIILGGSSGLGLATAKKLAQHGCNICIVHRNRKSELPEIKNQFESIKNSGVELLTFNVDAFKKEDLVQISKHLKAKSEIHWKWAFRYQWLIHN